MLHGDIVRKNHDGNRAFHKVVDQNKPIYKASTSALDRELLARNIVEYLDHLGGRFLRSTAGSWVEINRESAMKATLYYLSDGSYTAAAGNNTQGPTNAKRPHKPSAKSREQSSAQKKTPKRKAPSKKVKKTPSPSAFEISRKKLGKGKKIP